MTNKEAIRVLSALWVTNKPNYTDKEIREAIDIGINAINFKEKIDNIIDN